MPITTAKTPKVYVAVRAEFTEDGTMLPREITWEDGEKYEIDRVSQICQAAAMKAGGQGDRYTIWISYTRLFYVNSANHRIIQTSKDSGGCRS